MLCKKKKITIWHWSCENKILIYYISIGLFELSHKQCGNCKKKEKMKHKRYFKKIILGNFFALLGCIVHIIVSVSKLVVSGTRDQCSLAKNILVYAYLNILNKHIPKKKSMKVLNIMLRQLNMIRSVLKCCLWIVHLIKFSPR